MNILSKYFNIDGLFASDDNSESFSFEEIKTIEYIKLGKTESQIYFVKPIALKLNQDGKILEVIEMPVMTDGKKNKKQVNGAQIYNEFLKRINNKDNEIRVVIEQVSAMPGQGVTSMFNFGQSYGILKGICSAMQLPMFFVRPAKWKKYFNLINSQKDASRTRAIEIFPYFSTQLSKKKDSNKADAILIASFYYETHQKED